jgi:hypothetical protein
MTSRSKDIIFLLGAGASAEAGIPVSSQMIQSVEEHVRSRDDWRGFRQLYNHVKSAIHFSAGLKGRFGDGVPFNIEILVNTLYESRKKRRASIVSIYCCVEFKVCGPRGCKTSNRFVISEN